MNRPLRKNLGIYAALAGRIAAGAIFALSGFLKLMSPSEEFAAIIDSYQILPLPLVMYLAQILPWIELFAGICLLAGFLLRLASAGVVLMLAIFISALSSTLFRNIGLSDCGCYGEVGINLTPIHAIILDTVLIILACVVFHDRKKYYSLDRRFKST